MGGRRPSRSPSLASTFVAKAFETARLHGIDTLIVQADDHHDIRAIQNTRDTERMKK